MIPTIPPEIQIAGLICAVILAGLVGVWFFLKSRG